MSETIEDLITKTHEKDFVSANKIFTSLMQDKISAAMDQEKIRVAGQIYNGMSPEDRDKDDDDDQLEFDLDDEDEEDDEEDDSEEDKS